MDTSNINKGLAYWVPKLGEIISKGDKIQDITFVKWGEGDLCKAKVSNYLYYK